MRLPNNLSKIFPPAVLVLCALFFAWSSYAPGTWLTGWDNLHPEFDLRLGFKQLFWGVWQENRGLGLLSGMSHAADITRILMLMLLDLFLPAMLIRYVWFFLMLIIGPLGIYFFTQYLLGDAKYKFPRDISAFLAGFFYLSNLATVQYFYVPFETFINFYGFLPWLLLSSTRYLKEGEKNNILQVIAVSVLATSAFYVQTMFLVYAIILSIFIFESIIKKGLTGLARSFNLIAMVFIANAFWLMPSLYFSATQSHVLLESKSNIIATSETTLFNEARGGFKDVALMRGFWFDYTDLESGTKFGYLMPELRDWVSKTNLESGTKFGYLMPELRDWVSKTNVEYIGLSLYFIALIGLFGVSLQRKYFFGFSGALAILVCYFMLSSTNPPFGFIFKFIGQKLPLFENAFRSVFTKWSIAEAFFIAVGLGYFSYLITSSLYKSKKLKYLTLVVIFALAYGSYFVVKPVFSGNLIAKNNKVQIPQRYFDLFDFFKTQPKETRIATFPMQSFWGWNFYDWGYRGSGILWYGIEQPILDRAFDVWSSYNEGFYLEASSAFYGKDPIAFKRVMKKYRVSYFILDKSVIELNKSPEILGYAGVDGFFEKLGAERVFEKESLSVFAIDLEPSFIFSPQEATLIKTETRNSINDLAFERYGNYVIEDKLPVSEPFQSFLSDEIKNLTYKDINEQNVGLDFKIPETGNLVAPFTQNKSTVFYRTRISFDGQIILVRFLSGPSISGQTMELPRDFRISLKSPAEKIVLNLGKDLFLFSKEEEKEEYIQMIIGDPVSFKVFDRNSSTNYDFNDPFFDIEISKCWERDGAVGILESSVNDLYRTTKVKDAVGCLPFKIGDFSDSFLLNVRLPYRSHNQSKPYFCVLFEGSNECLHEDIFYNSLPSDTWTEVERDLILDKGSYWINIGAKPPDAEGQEWEIDYKQPNIISYQLIADGVLDVSEIWPNLSLAKQYDVKAGNLVSFWLDKKKIDFAKSGLVTPTNCSIFKDGSISKTPTPEGVLYKAFDKASLCDYVALPTIRTNKSYIIRFQGKNFSGRGLKFYLNNKSSGMNDLEALLQGETYDKTFVVPSWPNLEDKDYVLYLESRSFGNEVANLVSSIEIYEFPIEWVSSWQFVSNSGEVESKDLVVKSDLQINSVKKIGTYKYLVEATGNEGLLTLSQGYDSGWLGYDTTRGIFNFNKLKHVKVNSWSNGWIINNSSNKDGKLSVLLVYWPQYLEFAGFVILIGGLLWILLGYKDKERRLQKAVKS